MWLLLGPRQVGKSSLLTRCGPERQYINLDDLATRARANADPVLFARDLRRPLIIDEIQYAPELLSPIKQLADADGRPGIVWLTGSQSFQVMRGVRETLAGRVAILQLLGMPNARELPRLAPIAAANWRPGRVVTLALPAAQSITEEWQAIPPWELDLLLQPA